MLTDEESSKVIFELDVIKPIVMCLNSDQNLTVKYALGSTLNITLMNQLKIGGS